MGEFYVNWEKESGTIFLTFPYGLRATDTDDLGRKFKAITEGIREEMELKENETDQ